MKSAVAGIALTAAALGVAWFGLTHLPGTQTCAACATLVTGVRDPMVQLAANVAFGTLILALCLIAVERFRQRN